MRYVINIIGPRAVGKTTVIEELKNYLVEYTVLAIDDFRRMYDTSTPEGEMEAWFALYSAALKEQKIIIESSGTSNNLLQVIGGLTSQSELEMYNILLEADDSTLSLREKIRQEAGYKRPRLYFEPKGRIGKPTVPVCMRLNTEKAAPFEIASAIFDNLPSQYL
ncbi:hypothetical protein [Runella zeae]|uniref:hypothetical protein n=1 Tax=Runella zeae TaxID=94255 RepID=UPI002353E4DA|nr:hypothetical protein [Runella zeae]